MAIVVIMAVLAFGAVTSFIEIPKMLSHKLYKEFAAFCILLAAGMTLAILKSLNVKIPNPSDWVAWVYSPLKEVMKSMLK